MSKQQKGVQSGLWSKLLVGTFITVFFGVALFLRTYLPHNGVFSGDWIKFTGNDAYYFMRLVDNLISNFPHLIHYDPYLSYPIGMMVDTPPFFSWLLAVVAWTIGLGSPSQHTVDVVGVYFPAILGALTVIPVYFIGKEVFNRWVGVISAGLIALLPGEFLGRSTLGFTDYHVAETLFTTVAVLFLILALKAARQNEFTFRHLNRRDLAKSVKAVVYSLLAGIFLGLYLLTWAGGLLFVLTISVFFVVQFVVGHLRGEPTDYLCLVGTVLFAVTLLLYLPSSQGMLYWVSIVIALIIPPVLYGISRLMVLKKIRPIFYPLALVGAVMGGLAILYLVYPPLVRSMLSMFGIFVPSGVSLTTIEMRPLLSPSGVFSLSVAWGNFATSFFLSFISLIILIIYVATKRGSAAKSLLVVWSLAILLVTLGQRRFAYYFAVNAALLTGYLSVLLYHVTRWLFEKWSGERASHLSWQILELAAVPTMIHPAELPARPTTKKSRRLERKRARKTEIKQSRMKRRQETGFHLTGNHLSIGLSVIVIFLAVFSPLVVFPTPAQSLTVTTASQTSYAPSDAWVSSLSWMKENTPEPFGNPDFYYQFYEPPAAYRNRPQTLPEYRQFTEPEMSISERIDVIKTEEKTWENAESVYGVMAWWDYGYWITRIAHRVPSTNPGKHANVINLIAHFFVSQDEDSAQEIIKGLDASYVIVDSETATSKFWALAEWAGKKQTDFSDVYLLPQENGMFTSQMYIYPEYYRSLSTRLYNFDGKAVTPKSTLVISYEEKTDKKGTVYKIITSTKQFESYKEAEAYLVSQQSTNYKIVGTNPFISPVPLDVLEHYRLIHSSDGTVTVTDVGTVSEVKIFEYID
jgi:dolichyl-diphosphooligosaccharide--protein glycosyltransferase